MKHLHHPLSSLVLLTPLLGACAAQATITPPAVNANVDVNAQAGAVVDPNATVTAGAPQADSYDETDPSALTDFHTALDSHGTWVEDPTYGTVWVPTASEVGPEYTPYSTAGHWAYDDNNDYVWVSDYDWGWAPYHYGRWVEIDGRGWSWIPGRTYRGAWVTWGADDGYGTVGWAPMAPEYVWRGGVAVSYHYEGPSRWNYVGRGDVFSANVGTHVLRGSAAAGVAGHVHPTGSVGVHGSGGPPPERLGLTASTAPHVSGAGASSVAKAAQFGHPSTATQLGGHPPTHSLGATTMGTPGHVTGTSASTATSGVHGATMPGGVTGTSASTATAGVHGATTPGSMTGTSASTATTGVHGATVGTSGTPPQHGPLETGIHAVPTTETHVAPQTHTAPVTVQSTQGRKKPTTDPTPTPKANTGGGTGTGGHGGGATGGHGGPPPHQK